MKRALATVSLALMIACRRTPAIEALDAEPAATALDAAVAAPLAEGPSDPSPSETVPPVSSEPPPAGPAPVGSASNDDRKSTLVALLSGARRAGDLPESATNPGQGFDRGLRKRLTTVEVDVSDTSDPLGTSGPRADAQIDSPSATVPISDMNRVVAGLRPRIRQCYQTGLNADPTMAGKLVVSAVVGTNGEVTSANVASNAGLSPAVAACAAGVVRRVQFSPPASPSTLTVPIVLTQQK